MQEQPPRQRDIWLGVGAALLLHLIQIPLMFVTSFVSLIFMGISQLLYIGPAIAIYQSKGRPGVVKGLIIAAAITFLLNGACVVTYLNNHH